MLLTDLLSSALAYITLIWIFSAFWAGSVLEYRVAKHKVSIEALELFAQNLPPRLNRFYSPSSSFNYWTSKSDLDPYTQLRQLDFSHTRRIVWRSAAVVAIGVVLPLRQMLLDLSWDTALWVILSLGTVFYLRTWTFGAKLLEIEHNLRRSQSLT